MPLRPHRIRVAFLAMPPSSCLRSFSQLSVDRSIHSFVARSLLAPHTACFSTSVARYANPSPKKGKLTAAPKRGTKTLNVKKGRKAPQGDSGKKPAQGERKAQRKRIVLTNDNALEVSSLHDLAKGTIFSGKEEGHVRGIPEEVVVALKAVEAFKTTQGWGLFRRPATLMRKQTLQLASLLKEVEESEQGQKKTIRRVLSGERLGGKSTLLLQALTMAFLREWVVINLPEAQDIVNAHTEYAPLPASQPTQYTQDTYTANLLAQTLKANERVLGHIKVATNPTLPLPLPAKATLKQLTELGAINPDVSWPVFLALWEELSLPGRPPVMLAIDGLSHIMKNSDYLSAEVMPIHAHDLTLIRHFVDHLSGQKSLPNGGVVLAATSQSNAPTSPALDHSIQVAEMLQRDPNNLPRYDEYRKVDQRVMDVLKDLRDPKATGLDVIKVGGLSKDEARSIMEYYAESGMLRARVDDSFVSEKWCLAGMGNIGELERASVRQRI